MAEQKSTGEKLEIMALWANESKNGALYYTGHLNGLRVVAFPNTNKRNEKEPDLRIYVQAKQQGEDNTARGRDSESDLDDHPEYGNAPQPFDLDDIPF